MQNRQDRHQPHLSISQFLTLLNLHEEIQESEILASFKHMFFESADTYLNLINIQMAHEQIHHQMTFHSQEAIEGITKVDNMLRDRAGRDMTIYNASRYNRAGFFGIQSTVPSSSESSLSYTSDLSSSGSSQFASETFSSESSYLSNSSDSDAYASSEESDELTLSSDEARRFSM